MVVDIDHACENYYFWVFKLSIQCFFIHGWFLTFHLVLSDVMQTKRTKKAGIVGKYGKFDSKFSLYYKVVEILYLWEDVLLFCAFILLCSNNGRL